MEKTKFRHKAALASGRFQSEITNETPKITGNKVN